MALKLPNPKLQESNSTPTGDPMLAKSPARVKGRLQGRAQPRMITLSQKLTDQNGPVITAESGIPFLMQRKARAAPPTQGLVRMQQNQFCQGSQRNETDHPCQQLCDDPGGKTSTPIGPE